MTYFLILIPFIVFIFAISFFKKNKIHNEVEDIYNRVEKDSDFYINLLSKIAEDRSLKIIKEIKEDNDSLQIITFDWELFAIENEVPGLLSKVNFKKVIKIIYFLIKENNQWPLIKNDKNYYVPIDDKNGEINIDIIKENDLKEYLDDFTQNYEISFFNLEV